MRLGFWVTVGALSLVVLSGCTRVAGPAQTVSYFKAHPKALEAVWARCANDPGGLGRTPECINARQVEAMKAMGSFRNLPPMRFPPVPGAAKGAGSVHSSQGADPKLGQ